MSQQFREHLSAAINLAIERILNEYESQTYSEIIGVLETVKLEYYFEYLEAKKNDEEETDRDEEIGTEGYGRSP